MSSRTLYSLGFLLAAFCLGGAFYLQEVKGMAPCPLCMMQRYALMAMSVLFLIGALGHFRKLGQYLICYSALFVSFIGMVFAGRQAWLQYFPTPTNGDCGVSIEYLFKVLPWEEILPKLWQGGAECSHLGFQFLNLSLAEWCLFVFLFFIGFIFMLLKRVASR